MSELALPAIAIIAGFIGLIWSADRFVEGSASIAKNFGMPPLIIGLTIVSFGTSAPEILVSINAALSQAGELAIGNAIGSNIANIGLVLGVTALVATLPVQKHLLRHELPILLGTTVIAGFFLMDATLTLTEGLILLALLPAAVAYLVVVKKKSISPEEAALEEEITEMPLGPSIMWFVVGLALLVVSSRILVWGATETAEFFNVSPLIIGLTVVAVGTSLPELAASVASALKGHHEIALGNVIGSNLFNLLAVMSVPSLFAPLAMEADVFRRDYAAMGGLTLLLGLLTLYGLSRGKSGAQRGIGKPAGALLLVLYVLYYYFLF